MISTIKSTPNAPISRDAWSVALFLSISIVAGFVGYNTQKFGGNWDEYLILSRVFQFFENQSSEAFPAIYLPAFGWLRSIEGVSLDQIEAARVVIWALSLGTLSLIYSIARHFVSPRAALFSVFSYVTFIYVFEHLASFRGDPIITFLLLATARLVLSPSRLAAVAAGLCMSLAVLCSVKSALYGPAIAALLGYQLHQSRAHGQSGSAMAYAAVTTLSSIASFALLFGIQWLFLSGGDDLSRDVKWMRGAADKLLWSAGFFPRLDYATNSLALSYMFWLTWGMGIFLAGRNLVLASSTERGRYLTLLILASPVLSLLFYRNAFSYYYVFMLPLPAILCGLVIDEVADYKKADPVAHNIIMVVLLLGSTHVAWNAISDNFGRSQATQRALLNGVAEIFPEPVTYIDRCSMVSEYPKAGFFMETWKMEDYHQNGEPIMREIITERQPKFILANHLALHLHRRQQQSIYTLMPQDLKVLRANYIPHWGLVFVAGKWLTLEDMSTRKFEILIPGRYTIESSAPVEVNGNRHPPGAILHLARGNHSIRAHRISQEVMLRWGDNLPVPRNPMPPGPLFHGLM